MTETIFYVLMFSLFFNFSIGCISYSNINRTFLLINRGVYETALATIGEEGNPEATGDLSTLGARVAKYAVDTYDSWSYSQDNRHQDGYVDCSSMVSRAYSHFSYKIYDSNDTSGEIYRWCENHGKVISDKPSGNTKSSMSIPK